jgi:hypothetical protein
MSGGEVSGNTSSSSSSSSGGGVYVSGGTLFMSGGAVSGNTSSSSSSGGGGVYVSGGTFFMSGGAVSGNTSSSYGGGVYVSDGTFSMSDGEVSGNILSGNQSYGREVLVVGGTFQMRGKARPERVFLFNNAQSITISGPLNGPVTPIDLGVTGSAPLTAYVYRPILKRDSSYSTGNLASLKTHFTLGNSKRTDSPYTEEAAISGYEISNGGGFIVLPSAVSDITYSDVSGGAWALESDGRRKSPAISHNGVTKLRVSFTSGTNGVIKIQLDVSSEQGYDYAFISTLDNASATYDNGYFTGSRISGTATVTVSIPVPTAGSHFIDIGYQKDSADSGGSDCAWFRVVE